MQPTPPLQLNHYFFPVVSVLANPDYSPEKVEGKSAPLCDVEVIVRDHGGDVYEVQMDVRVKSTEENPSPYNLALKSVGIFGVSPSLENKEAFVKSAGSSILYSASRDFLLTIMSRGPWTPIMLNLLTFRPEPPASKDIPSQTPPGSGLTGGDGGRKKSMRRQAG